MSDPKPTGPSPEFFRHLKDQLPAMKRDLEKKRALRGQIPVADLVPKKVCSVCGKGFDWGPIKGPIPELALCDRCDKLLKDGYAALVSDNRYAFIHSPSLSDMSGQIVKISPEVMEAIQKHFVAEWITNEEEKPNKHTDTSGQGQDPLLN